MSKRKKPSVVIFHKEELTGQLADMPSDKIELIVLDSYSMFSIEAVNRALHKIEVLTVDEAHYVTGRIPSTDDPIYEKVFIDDEPAVIPHKATAAKFRAIEERKKLRPKR